MPRNIKKLKKSERYKKVGFFRLRDGSEKWLSSINISKHFDSEKECARYVDITMLKQGKPQLNNTLTPINL